MLLKLWPSAVLHAGVIMWVSACAGAGDHPQAPSLLFTDSIGRCDLPEHLAVAPESTAVHCAEWFVARNGYTASVPDDSVALRGESIEVGAMARSRRDVLAERNRQLAGRAVLVCRSSRIGGYGVGIPYEHSIGADTGRLITMDTTFSDIQVQHVQPLALDSLTVEDGACRRIAPARRGAIESVALQPNER